MRSSNPLSTALVVAALLSGCGDREDLSSSADVEQTSSSTSREGLPVRGADELAQRDGLIVEDDGRLYTGLVEERDPADRKEFEMEVRDGKPSGLLKIWDPASGKKRVQARYTAGKLGSVKVWDAAGARIPFDPDDLRGFEHLEDPFESIRREDGTEGEALVDRLLPPLPGRLPNDQSPVEQIPEEDIAIAHPSQVREMRGNVFWRETDEPFTGKVSAEYDDHSSYEQYYVDGRPHGRSTSYYSNGQKRLEEHFIEGMKEGPFTAWHENGQKQFETTVENGRQLGISQHWNPDGDVIARWNYTEDGQILNAFTP